MPAQPVDLKSLLLMIKDNKDVDANLCLDEGCTIETDDVKPLVKVINYFLNYMGQVTTKPIEVGLDLRSDGYLLSFLAFCENISVSELSDQIGDALKLYNATFEKTEETGKYIQYRLHFAR
jgi:hypothetical protein